MIFLTSLVAVLSLACLTIAAPHLHSRQVHNVDARQPANVAKNAPYPRGSMPNGFMPNPNVLADITITQLQDTVIQNQNSEVELVQLVQEKIIVVDNSRQLRDNVRRNTFKNRNNNSDNNVNVVVVVVQQVIDQRQGGNDVRYIARKLNSNSNSNQEEVFVVISDANAFTIRPNDQATRVQSILAASTGVPAQQYAIYNPAANLTQSVASNSTISARSLQGGSEILLPSGSSAPQWQNAQQSVDPAVILDFNTNEPVFVAFNNQNSNDQNDVAIVVVN